MSIESMLVGSTAVVAVKGSFDIGSYEAFNQAFSGFIGNVDQFRIDLATTTYMDSSALGMLLLLKEKAGEAAHIELVNADDEVAHILKIAQFNQLFDIR